MGDLYPVIEGPVKFRDGKKVKLRKNVKLNQLFLIITLIVLLLVEEQVCKCHKAITSGW